MGAAGNDIGYGISIDSSGNVYVIGQSTATWGNPKNTFAGGADAFLAKFDSSGNRLWNTFMGAVGNDIGYGIAIDSSGNVYVTGQSTATWGNPKNTFAGGPDAFLAKFDSSGNRLWNTFMGAAISDIGDIGRGIAIDPSGNVYVTGDSTATWGNPKTTFTGGLDAFLAKFDSSGNRLWNTFLGSTSIDYGRGIAIDPSGNVYVTGDSTATWGSPKTTFAGNYDAFLAKFDSSGNRLWNTFMGAAGYDYGYGIAVDLSGNAYVTGDSTATWGSPKTTFAGNYDAFLAKFDSSGNSLWNTFMGSVSSEDGRGIAIDPSGNVYVTGDSGEGWGSPINPFTTGSYDVFVAKFDSSGNRLWNTFMGAADYGEDYGYGITIDSPGNVYVAGYSTATWGSPISPFTGGADALVVKLGIASIKDSDGDSILDYADNCPNKPNSLSLGSCSSTSDNPGIACTSDADCVIGCSSNGLCIRDQRDGDGDGIGDVCDVTPITTTTTVMPTTTTTSVQTTTTTSVKTTTTTSSVRPTTTTTSVRPTTSTTSSVLPVPNIPTNLSATAISSSQINLNWTDNSANETGFKIERAASSSGPFYQIATVGASVTSYPNTGLSPKTTYYYQVRAYNATGNSGYSNIANAKTKP